VTHILSSAAHLIELRARIRMHTPTSIWLVSLLLIQIQIWWAAFHGSGTTDWHFFNFLLWLLAPVGAAMLGYLLVPDAAILSHMLNAESRAGVDFEELYLHNRRWFFGLLAAIVLVSLVVDVMRDGARALDVNALFRLVFLGMLGAGILTASRRAHLAFAWAFPAGFLCYIGLFSARL